MVELRLVRVCALVVGPRLVSDCMLIVGRRRVGVYLPLTIRKVEPLLVGEYSIHIRSIGIGIGNAAAFAQSVCKASEPVGVGWVEAERPRELDEQRSELSGVADGAEGVGEGEESGWVGQLGAVVGEVAGEFEGKAKMRGGLCRPGGGHARRRNPVEAGVDLCRIEEAREEDEGLEGARARGGVDDAIPIGVAPAGSADPKTWGRARRKGHGRTT